MARGQYLDRRFVIVPNSGTAQRPGGSCRLEEISLSRLPVSDRYTGPLAGGKSNSPMAWFRFELTSCEVVSIK